MWLSKLSEGDKFKFILPPYDGPVWEFECLGTHTMAGLIYIRKSGTFEGTVVGDQQVLLISKGRQDGKQSS